MTQLRRQPCFQQWQKGLKHPFRPLFQPLVTQEYIVLVIVHDNAGHSPRRKRVHPTDRQIIGNFFCCFEKIGRLSEENQASPELNSIKFFLSQLVSGISFTILVVYKKFRRIGKIWNCKIMDRYPLFSERC